MGQCQQRLAMKSLTQWAEEPVEASTNFMNIDAGGPCMGCMGAVAAARMAQALVARCHEREPVVLGKEQRYKFGRDS